MLSSGRGTILKPNHPRLQVLVFSKTDPHFWTEPACRSLARLTLATNWPDLYEFLTPGIDLVILDDEDLSPLTLARTTYRVRLLGHSVVVMGRRDPKKRHAPVSPQAIPSLLQAISDQRFSTG